MSKFTVIWPAMQVHRAGCKDVARAMKAGRTADDEQATTSEDFDTDGDPREWAAASLIESGTEGWTADDIKVLACAVPTKGVIATKAAKPVKAAKVAKVQTFKPIPDLSGYSLIKRRALLRCWQGASKSPEGRARYDGPIAEVDALIAAEPKPTPKPKVITKGQPKVAPADVAPAIAPPSETAEAPAPKTKRTKASVKAELLDILS